VQGAILDFQWQYLVTFDEFDRQSADGFGWNLEFRQWPIAIRKSLKLAGSLAGLS